MRVTLLAALLIATAACRDQLPDGKDPEQTDTDKGDTDVVVDTDTPVVPADSDGDGVDDEDDCAPDDASVYPGATEVPYNGVDDDCDPATADDDLDADGFVDAEDCDDADAAINPAAPELCNGLDDDCDAAVDEEPADGTTWYLDADGDSFGSAVPLVACAQPADHSPTPGDCDDADADAFPGADELCNGRDDDCDTFTDEADATDPTTWYADADNDGFGATTVTLTQCDAPAGYVATPGDCDDGSAAALPGGTEVCDGLDNDCNGLSDEDAAVDAPTWYADVDGDRVGDDTVTAVACVVPLGFVGTPGDCDDAVPSVFPAAPELCDGLDNDCDGTTDEGAGAPATWYADGDGDGFGVNTDTLDSCQQPDGYVAAPGDCDDAADSVFPGATEDCDPVDRNCDGDPLAGAPDGTDWFLDADGDGVGGALVQNACVAPTGFVAADGDCDDLDDATFPGADETCDAVDNDCDGTADEDAIDPTPWYADLDGDTFGAGEAVLACEAPDDHVDNAADCDDTSAAARPGGVEVCDTLDNDCDGTVDVDALDPRTFWTDADGDGWGQLPSVEACVAPAGTAPRTGDCDDTVATTNPGASETCNAVDDDCDGGIDLPLPADAPEWFRDVDGDGAPGAAVTTRACAQPAGHGDAATDCDDGDAAVFPGAVEVCNHTDDNCDGDTDEGVTETFWADADGDGWGDPSAASQACSLPPASVDNDGDCDDTDAAVSPNGVELCNGRDDDCSGAVDDGAADVSTWYADTDGDAYGDPLAPLEACEAPPEHSAFAGDCDDTLAEVNPAADETCNGRDDDCDGDTDDDDAVVLGTTPWYLDFDGDTHGGATFAVEACVAPTGYVARSTDCNDAVAEINPDAEEICNGADDDCDGVTDPPGATGGDTWYADTDGDGFGDPDAPFVACTLPPAHTDVLADCDDTDAATNPDAQELAGDNVDNDCDGEVDELPWAGTGADGDLVVTGVFDLSTDSSNNRIEPDAVAYPVLALTPDTVIATTDILGIAPGDAVLVLNLQGSATRNTHVGAHEFGEVVALVGDTLTLAEPLTATFGENTNADLTDQRVVVQRVPQYANVTVEGTLTTGAWDGTTGGVLAIRVADTLVVDPGATIDVSERGYRGGETGTCQNCDAFQGESYGGPGIGDVLGGPYNETNGAWAANLGGGGALVTGAGGNYGGGATDADSWDGGNASIPRAGLPYGDDALTGWFLGSGGGGVWNGGTDGAGEMPGPGGDGGGILWIGAANVTATNSAAFQSIGGTTPYWAWGTWTYGAGGGAGGSVYLRADVLDLGTTAVRATGGFGEATHIRFGGDGGVGRVRIDCNVCNGFAPADAVPAMADASDPDPGTLTAP
jgi:hypothetical protein